MLRGVDGAIGPSLILCRTGRIQCALKRTPAASVMDGTQISRGQTVSYATGQHRPAQSRSFQNIKHAPAGSIILNLCQCGQGRHRYIKGGKITTQQRRPRFERRINGRTIQSSLYTGENTGMRAQKSPVIIPIGQIKARVGSVHQIMQVASRHPKRLTQAGIISCPGTRCLLVHIGLLSCCQRG